MVQKITKDKELQQLMLSMLTEVLDLPEAGIQHATPSPFVEAWLDRVREDAAVLAPKLSEEIQEAAQAANHYRWCMHYDYSDRTHQLNVAYAELLGELADVANCLIAFVFSGHKSDEELEELRRELSVLRTALEPNKWSPAMLFAIVTRAYAKGLEVATRPHRLVIA